MPSSDSEDFESADEGHIGGDKKERRKRNSSSNYSENALETEGDTKRVSSGVDNKENIKENMEGTDGWDEFDFDDTEAVKTDSDTQIKSSHTENVPTSKIDKVTEAEKNSKDTGWDDFGDWGSENITTEKPTKSQSKPDPDIDDVTNRLAATTTSPTSSGWGWGWGMDSLLSTTTAGISTLTNQVSQGLTTVLESGIGAPDPEELARKTAAQESSTKTPDDEEKALTDDANSASQGVFSFGKILKFVGDTGTKVVQGGLDTLEIIGRKTMDMLENGDPHLEKKRALLGLDPTKPILSQVLREAKARAEEEDRIREEKREAKEVHYERLFDDFGGLIHLEALEMLSKQVNMQIEEKLRTCKPSERTDLKETLQQIIELCELPEDEDYEEYSEQERRDLSLAELFNQRLEGATADITIPFKFEPIVKHYSNVLDWIENPDSDLSLKNLHKRAISALAEATAHSVELYHKASESMIVLKRRSTADEADAITTLTLVLTKHISELASIFTDKLHNVSTAENYDQARDYITKIHLEAGNSSTYIHSAFLLTQPILQIGTI